MELNFFVTILFSLKALPNHNEGDLKRAKKTNSSQYGYWKGGTQAQVSSQTLVHIFVTKDKDREEGKK